MLATSFLGVVDCFDQSMPRECTPCAAPSPNWIALHAVNVSDGLRGTCSTSRTEKLRQACAPEVFEELLRLNALDRQLVDRARAEVLRRFEQIPQPGRAAHPKARRIFHQGAGIRQSLRLRFLPERVSRRRRHPHESHASLPAPRGCGRPQAARAVRPRLLPETLPRGSRGRPGTDRALSGSPAPRPPVLIRCSSAKPIRTRTA